MSTEQRLDVLQRALFADPAQRVYAVLDGASIPLLPELLDEHEVDHVCLYRGELDEALARAAPYLAELDADSGFTQLLLKKGWGQHWGVVALSSENLRAMRQHFRKFLIVWNADARPLYFRYYDPRVLRTYLPTCTADELAVVFGPVNAYLLEDRRPDSLLRFTLGADGLGAQPVNLPAGTPA